MKFNKGLRDIIGCVVSRTAYRLRLPGRWRLKTLMERLGCLNGVVLMPFYDSWVYVPVSEGAAWAQHDLSDYQERRISNLAKKISELPELDYTLIDCGANLGLFGLQLARKCPRIRRIIAIEPNKRYARLAEANLALSNISAETRCVAISNFRGKGKLQPPDYDSSEHGWQLVRDDLGDIDVIMLDDLMGVAGENIIMKLDVEGEELSAIKSANALISHASNFAAFIEFHKNVLSSKGQTDDMLMQSLGVLRKVEWFDSADINVRVRPGSSVFEQTRQQRQCDLIAVDVR